MNSIYKKKRLFIFFLFFIFFNITYISNSYSQSSIAVLDVLVMLKDSSAAKSMKEQLDKSAKQYTDEEKKQAKEIQRVMETCVELEVPSKADIDLGESWGG